MAAIVLLASWTLAPAAPTSEVLEGRLREHLSAEFPESVAIHGEVVSLFVEPARILDDHYGGAWPQAMEEWYWKSTVSRVSDLRPSSMKAGLPMDYRALESRLQLLQSVMSIAPDSLKAILANDWGIEQRGELEESIDECRLLLIKHLRSVISEIEYVAVNPKALEGVGRLDDLDHAIVYSRYDFAIADSPLTASAREQFAHDIRSALVRSRIEELVEVMHEASRRLVLPIFAFGVYYPKYLERDPAALESAMSSFVLEGDILVMELDPLFELYGHGTTFCHLYLGVITEPKLEPLIAADDEPGNEFEIFDAASLMPRNSLTPSPEPSFSLVRSRFSSE